MRHITHPFFGVLYIHDINGVFWEESLRLGKHRCPTVMVIDRPEAVTQELLNKAAILAKRASSIYAEAQSALEKDFQLNTFGTVWQYLHAALTAIGEDVLRQQFPKLSAKATLEEALLPFVQPSFFGIWPIEEETPAILDFSLLTEKYPFVLSVLLDAQGKAVEISEEPLPT